MKMNKLKNRLIKLICNKNKLMSNNHSSIYKNKIQMKKYNRTIINNNNK